MPPIIPKRVLEEIRFKSDIADVVGSYIDLKRSGSTLKALCPFHKEKTPSFNVNQQRQIYHCFGCGKGGDVFSFVMEYEGVDFMTAVKILAEKAGVPLELEQGDRDTADKAALYKVHAELAAFYRRCLLQTQGAAAARAYLEERKLTGDIAEAFGIGYAPRRWDAALQWAARHKTPPNILEQGGLVIRRERDGGGRARVYDRFRDRIMFPIADELGRVIGFSGRALEAGERTAKYVNSPETPLFRKSRVLYAMDKARRAIADCRDAILCEGQIDVIRCHQAGLTTAVASQGTAFTEEHARILHRYADSVTLVFDPDSAGQDAAVKAAGIFLQAGLAVRVAALPPGQDPDTFLVDAGADAFRALLDRAVPAVRYQVDLLAARDDLQSEAGVMRASRAVLQTILNTPNAVQQAHMVEEAAALLKLPPRSLLSELAALRRRRTYRGDEPDEAPAPGWDAPAVDAWEAAPLDERELCVYLAQGDPELLAAVDRYIPRELWTHRLSRAYADACREAADTGQSVEEILRNSAEWDPQLEAFAARAVMTPPRIAGEEFSALDAVHQLVLSMWRRALTAERAATAPENYARRFELTHDLDSLKTWDHGADIIELRLAQDL